MLSRRGGPNGSVSNVGAESDKECAGRAERQGRVWGDGAGGEREDEPR